MRGIQASNYMVQLHRQTKTSYCFKESIVYILHLVFVVIMIMLLLLSFQEGLVQSPRELLNEAVGVLMP